MNIINKINAKGIPGFIAKGICFLFILFILDYSIGGALRYLYFKQDAGLLYRTTYSLDSTTADFLIFGSSTANHHYEPSIFENRLDMSVYNTGRDANTIFYNYAVFQSILKRYRPKAAILDFNVGEFKVMQDNYDVLSSLLPYYHSNPEVQPIIQLKGPFEKFKLISKIYPFNSLLFTILVGNTEYNKSRDYINDQNGFIPLEHIWKKSICTIEPIKKYKLDTTKIRILKSFVQECENNNIKLYICISPRFIKYTEKDLSVEIVHKIADEYNVPFYNFSNDTLFWNHPGYFADQVHLNSKGAEVFSNKVIDKIMHNQEKALTNEQKNLSSKLKEK